MVTVLTSQVLDLTWLKIPRYSMKLLGYFSIFPKNFKAWKTHFQIPYIMSLTAWSGLRPNVDSDVMNKTLRNLSSSDSQVDLKVTTLWGNLLWIKELLRCRAPFCIHSLKTGNWQTQRSLPLLFFPSSFSSLPSFFVSLPEIFHSIIPQLCVYTHTHTEQCSVQKMLMGWDGRAMSWPLTS